MEADGRIQASMAGIVTRIEALTTATGSLRTLLSERLNDLGDQTDRAQQSTARDLEAQHRVEARTLADIEAALSETEQAVLRLDQANGKLAAGIEAGFGAVSQEVRRATGRLGDDAAARAQAIGTTLAALSVSVAAAQEGLRAQRSQLDTVAAAIEELDGRLDRAEAAWKLGPKDLLGSVDAVRSDLGQAIRTAVDELGTTTATASAVEALHGAVRRIEEAVDRPASGNATALSELQQTVARLAEAQAEDLERILEVVEGGAALEIDSTLVMERLDLLGTQLQSLRRRMTLRGRAAGGPQLDEATLTALADAVAARLRGG